MSRFRVPLHNNPGEADDIKNLVIMKRLLAAADQGTLDCIQKSEMRNGSVASHLKSIES